MAIEPQKDNNARMLTNIILTVIAAAMVSNFTISYRTSMQVASLTGQVGAELPDIKRRLNRYETLMDNHLIASVITREGTK